MVDFKYYDGGQDIYVRIRNANGIIIDRIYDVPESQWNDCRLTTVSFAGLFSFNFLRALISIRNLF